MFDPRAQFKDFCSSPRSGLDVEGNPFPDRQGVLLDELNWLRSWTHETYLWRDDIVDQDPAAFTNTTAYFDTLKTNDVRPSGRDVDDFHFAIDSAEYLESVLSVEQAGYGLEVSVQNTPNLVITVAYTEPDSPAAQIVSGLPNMPRGARIIAVDGVTVRSGVTQADIDPWFQGLFPSTAGETHEFLIREVDNTQRNVTMTSAEIATAPVNRTKVIDTPNGRVGYMLLNTFGPFASEAAIANAITDLNNQNIDELVLDLRYNGGGLIAVAAQLGYQIAGPTRTLGKDFTRLVNNGSAGDNDPVSGRPNIPTPFINEGVGFSVPAGQALDSLDLSRVFILATEDTCSASELVLNSLRGIDLEVILIGTTTCGKPYGFVPQDNCGTTFFTIQFQSVNHKDFGDYQEGFSADPLAPFAVNVPGCALNDDFTAELGDQNEGLLSAALTYIDTGACPVASQMATAGISRSQGGAIVGRAFHLKDAPGQTTLTPDPLEEALENSFIITPVERP